MVHTAIVRSLATRRGVPSTTASSSSSSSSIITMSRVRCRSTTNAVTDNFGSGGKQRNNQFPPKTKSYNNNHHPYYCLRSYDCYDGGLVSKNRRALSSSSTNSSSSNTKRNTNNNNNKTSQKENDTAERLPAAGTVPSSHKTVPPQVQLDFFGEPVTFLQDDDDDSTTSSNDTNNARAALDGFLLAIVSKGKTCVGGGEEEGTEIQAVHSSAIAWSEVLRHAAVWNNPTQNNNNNNKSAPMLVVAAVAPLLAQGCGTGYLRRLDLLLQQVPSGVPGLDGPIQMLPMAQHVVAVQRQQQQQSAAGTNNHQRLWDHRERCHVKALDYMLHNQHAAALTTLLELLRKCPGDVLGLSLAMDLANTVGDTHVALRAATSTAGYWNERKGGFIRPAIPGYAIACAYQALGLAVGGRYTEAESLANHTLAKGKKVCGAVSTWALAHVFDAEGRTAEGISFLANSDGMDNYEKSGFLFFEDRLATYGGRFSLDREERGRNRSSAALRLYESHVERILQYSGYSRGTPWLVPQRKAPMGWSDREHDHHHPFDSSSEKEKKADEKKEEDHDNNSNNNNIFTILSNRWRSSNNDNNNQQNEIGTNNTEANNRTDANEAEIVQTNNSNNYSPTRFLDKPSSCEDVLTWLPPTPQLLSDATYFLWRLTLNGTLPAQDYRWDHLRNAWNAVLALEKEGGEEKQKAAGSSSSSGGGGGDLEHFPLACMAASILIPPEMSGGDKIGTGRMASGLHTMGELMGLGGTIGKKTTSEEDDDDEDSDKDGSSGIIDIQKQLMWAMTSVAETQPDFWYPAGDNEVKKQWKTVVDYLVSAMDGFDYNEDDETTTTTNNNNNVGNPIMDIETCERFDAGWTFDARPLFEHTVVYAACKAGDTESLCRARAICSQGVTLRPNSPEEWWRYSIVLGLLGDEVASENAFATSVNLGGGQGARK